MASLDLIKLACPSCNAPLKIRRGVSQVSCDYCHVSFEVPEEKIKKSVVPDTRMHPAYHKGYSRSGLIILACFVLPVIGFLIVGLMPHRTRFQEKKAEPLALDEHLVVKISDRNQNSYITLIKESGVFEPKLYLCKLSQKKDSSAFQVVWKSSVISTQDTIYSAHDAQFIYIVTGTALSAFSIETGKLIYEVFLSDKIDYWFGEIRLATPYIVVYSADKMLQVFEQTTGHLLWQRKIENFRVKVIIFDQQIGWETNGIVPSERKEKIDYLQFYDLRTGKETGYLVPKVKIGPLARDTYTVGSLIIQDALQPWVIYVNIGCGLSAEVCNLQKWNVKTKTMIWDKPLVKARLADRYDRYSRTTLITEKYLFMTSEDQEIFQINLSSAAVNRLKVKENYRLMLEHLYQDKLIVAAESLVGTPKFELWSLSLDQPEGDPKVLKTSGIGSTNTYLGDRPIRLYSPSGIHIVSGKNEENKAKGNGRIVYERFDWQTGSQIKNVQMSGDYPRLFFFSPSELLAKLDCHDDAIIRMDLETKSEPSPFW